MPPLCDARRARAGAPHATRGNTRAPELSARGRRRRPRRRSRRRWRERRRAGPRASMRCARPSSVVAVGQATRRRRCRSSCTAPRSRRARRLPRRRRRPPRARSSCSSRLVQVVGEQPVVVDLEPDGLERGRRLDGQVGARHPRVHAGADDDGVGLPGTTSARMPQSLPPSSSTSFGHFSPALWPGAPQLRGDRARHRGPGDERDPAARRAAGCRPPARAPTPRAPCRAGATQVRSSRPRPAR